VILANRCWPISLLSFRRTSSNAVPAASDLGASETELLSTTRALERRVATFPGERPAALVAARLAANEDGEGGGIELWQEETPMRVQWCKTITIDNF
jgi:hypothetical protein